MPKVPYIPSSAPFTREQRAWLNGFLVGLFSETEAEADRPWADRTIGGATAQRPSLSLLVMYGSQTGTAEQLAKRLANEAPKHGFVSRLLEMNSFASLDLRKEERLVIVTSTWGDGDPPDNAAAFWMYLSSESAPKLDHLRFSVLALGDKNYGNFCGAGKKFDERLEQLGAKRIHPRADCDVDYEAIAKIWMESLWPRLIECDSSAIQAVLTDTANSNRSPNLQEPQGNADCAQPAAREERPSGGALGQTRPANFENGKSSSSASAYGRANPFPARLLANRRLNAPGSAKDTRHFEISLDRSTLDYQVGDALGVMPSNCPALVDELLQRLGCDGEEAVPDREGVETSLRRALLDHYQITQPAPSFVEAMAERAGDSNLRGLLEAARKSELDQFLYGREVIDLLLQFSNVRFGPVEFVALLRKLKPRLYSISSSPKMHPGEVHLTVAAVRYESYGRGRKGVCSTFLADRAHESTAVSVFVQPSHGFRLPNDPNRPVIMIGPGTGVAPFRAFLEERRALGAKGRNWLFFGDQQQACDFLYRDGTRGHAVRRNIDAPGCGLFPRPT